eukprot:Sdes_comp18216_c0_seq1m7793
MVAEFKTCGGKFNNSGSLFCLVTQEGKLKIWDVVSGKLTHEYCHENHLVNRITSISWPPQQILPKRKKNPKINSNSNKSETFLALGTEAGTLLIYNLIHASVEVEFSKSHARRINDIVWTKDLRNLYTASDDKYIAKWSVETQSQVCRWKGDSYGVHSLCLNEENSGLLSAGRTIKYWDLETQKVKKTFAGHQNAVKSLAFSADQEYFFSHAELENQICVWKFNSSENSSCISSFPTTENVLSFHLISSLNSSCRLVTLESNSTLQIFLLDLKKQKDDLILQSTLFSFVDPKVKKPFPLLGVAFDRSNSDQQIKIVRNSSLLPVFETISYLEADGDFLESQIFERNAHPLLKPLQPSNPSAPPHSSSSANLITNSSSGMKSTTTTATNATASPSTKSSLKISQTPAVKILGPINEPLAVMKEDGKEDVVFDKNEISMEEQMARIGIQSVSKSVLDDFKAGKKSKNLPPKAESMEKLLVQALHSNDQQLLEECLGTMNEAMIHNTIKRLPTQYVIPFLTQTIHKFQAKPSRGVFLVPWIKSVLMIHTSYLISLPDLSKTLGGLYQMVDSRLSNFKKFLKLNGRLDLIMSQVATKGVGPQFVDIVDLQDSSAIYRDEDEEEDQLQDDDDEDSIIDQMDTEENGDLEQSEQDEEEEEEEEENSLSEDEE